MTTHIHHHDEAEHHHHRHHPPYTDWLKSLLLLGLGGYFLYIIASGNLSNYINIRFAWLSYLAAGLFILLGVVSLYALLRPQPHEHDHCQHDHDHSTISWPVLGVIAIPLLLGLLVPSQPLGAAAVDGDFNAIGGEMATALDIPPQERNMLDWVRLFNASDDVTAFNGAPVNITGFVFHDESYPDGVFMMARFTISCCVADSVAIGIPVSWTENLPADSWIQVKGQLQTGIVSGREQPIIHASTVDIIDRPEHPYLYP